MKVYLTAIICSALLATGLISIQAKAEAADAADSHVAAAKAIAASVPKAAKNELDYDYIVQTECTQPKPATAAQEAAALNRPPNTNARPHADWYVDPVKVFDNLYYLGTNIDSVWAVTTSAGIILIDAN